MAVTTYAGWIANGKPAYEAQPILDMFNMFQSHGYTVYWYPDQRHLTANPPEDHTPFSHTPWPGVQPYPLCLALDLMPKGAGGGASLAPIARRILADKRSGVAPWIKYMNWTDEAGKVWHTKWQPDEVTSTSTDSGHIHLSVRTDYADPAQAQAAGHSIYAAQGWDPITGSSGSGDEMAGAFLATAGGQYYLCDGKKSVKISASRANVLAYLSTEGSGSAIDLGHAANFANNAEWTSTPDKRAGMVRMGWTSDFGPAVEDNGGVNPVTLTDAQISALAAQISAQIEAGATEEQVKAIINGTKLATP